MKLDRARPVLRRLVAILVILGLVGPALASPAPVSGCPPCSTGFTSGAAHHGLDTEVQHSEATVRVHTNGSATWTARVVPTNETVLNRLAENHSLARAVAADSFGTRYGDGISHELIGVTVANGTFEMRYRTLDVVQQGPLGTRVFTYFRDSPGAYVYTELGADEVTVIAPKGMTIAQGFGDVTGDRMTATELPDVQDGPFVVVAPKGSFAPDVLAGIAVASALSGILVRNVLFFVGLPGGVLIGGLAGIRRFFGSTTDWTPTRLGSIVAACGGVLLAGTVLSEGAALPAVTGPLLVGGVSGVLLLALGTSVAVARLRRHLSGLRFVGVGIVLGIGAAIVTAGPFGATSFHRTLALGVALLPAAVGLGWIDAGDGVGDRSRSTRLLIGLSVAIIVVLAVSQPLTAVGGTLFLLVPVVLTIAAVALVGIATPLYVLGTAGANSQ